MNKTKVFAIAVATLIAVTYYFEFYKVSAESEKKEAEAQLVSIPADKIQELRVENESGKILLKRSVDGWQLEEPLKDWADSSFVDDFIEGLATEKALDVAAEGDSIQWSAFGLDAKVPGVHISKVSFIDQQGKAVEFQVSQKKNFEGNSLLRRGQENKVFIASSQWPLRAEGKPINFRDKRLFRGKIGSVEEITVHSQKDQFKLVRDQAAEADPTVSEKIKSKEKKELGFSQWIAEKEPKLHLDQNRVREVLTSLNEMRAEDYVDAIPKNAAFRASILLKLADKSWSAELRQTDDKVIYAHTSDPEFNMKMTPGQSDKLFQMTLSSLRDHKEPFVFKSASVQRIEIQTPLKKTILVKAANDWKVEGDSKVKVDSAAVQNFITRLSESAVTDYLSKSDLSNFKSAGNFFRLKDDKQNLLFELSWGPTVKAKTPVGDKTLVLAKSSLYVDPFGLDQSVIESWGILKLFPPEAP